LEILREMFFPEDAISSSAIIFCHNLVDFNVVILLYNFIFSAKIFL